MIKYKIGESMEKLFIFLFLAILVVGFGSSFNYLVETSKMEKTIKEKNKKYLSEKVLIEKDSVNRGFSDRINDWISVNVDKENQDVYKAFAARIKDCTQSADNSEEFRNYDYDLVFYPFCIQGEKDIKLFEEFAQIIVYESPDQRKLLEMARKKHSRKEKTKVPRETDINEFCGFKS